MGSRQTGGRPGFAPRYSGHRTFRWRSGGTRLSANRAAFVAEEQAYGDKFGLTGPQRAAVAARDVPAMLAAGGNVYYLAKLAGIFGLNVQDLGALQKGCSVAQFKAMLLAQRAWVDPALDGLHLGPVAALWEYA